MDCKLYLTTITPRKSESSKLLADLSRPLARLKYVCLLAINVDLQRYQKDVPKSLRNDWWNNAGQLTCHYHVHPGLYVNHGPTRSNDRCVITSNAISNKHLKYLINEGILEREIASLQLNELTRHLELNEQQESVDQELTHLSLCAAAGAAILVISDHRMEIETARAEWLLLMENVNSLYTT